MEQLAELIKKAHNPMLVKPNEAPAGNMIYHVYNDGEVTLQKGGDAYLCRSESIMRYGFSSTVSSDLFPMKIDNGKKIHGYAIVTSEDAYKIHDEIYKILTTKKSEEKKN
jgi:hypothetical protein